MNKAVSSFLSRNREKFGSADGLPGDFHRARLFEQTKVGATAALLSAHGNVLSGRVVMKFATHAVVNLGGAHGTPGVVTAENCIYAAGAAL